ncbi:ankyrin repeat domain-containing protein SOWAHC [Sceloporus undulatus]|uniref:ankyrin repeat domain-containing protein SOWAHC n=1 Tax=Sceloporus undulatus TaxID=8520 RepID=UPI001C4ACFB4|nr:ankyrin repeat domain-containing protein SOWAHC [Sceloporus undulatus]
MEAPSQASLLRFLSERGGRAPNSELLEHFRASLESPEPQRRALARQRFKEMVNAVATVRQEPGSGAKYVQLRKKYLRNSNSSNADHAVPPPPESPRGRDEGEAAPGQREGRTEGRPVIAGAEDEAKGREGEAEVAKAREERGALAAAAAATPPRGGRKAFLERRALGSSPQMKRGGRDSDSASVASSSAEEEGNGGGSVALDPLEHAWMLSASEGRWESLEALLGCEPSLLGKRDFVTGFSCLHWAAKLGRAELLALLVTFARRRGLSVDINARTAAGYTALHLAALHGHLEVVKLLVGAYDADVELRDYSGRKAAHYLGGRGGASEGLRGLVGEEEEEEEGAGTEAPGGRWRLSRVLPAQLLASRLPHLHLHGEEAEGAGGEARELSRKGSGGGGGRRSKPRLNKVRFRTQIIHTTPSFRGEPQEDPAAAEEEEEEKEGAQERPPKGSFKLRPKSNVFG